MDIFIDNRTATNLPQDSHKIIEDTINATLKVENIQNDIEVSVSIVTNNEIQKLNKDFRKMDKVTDVLSFPMYEKEMLENIDVKEILTLGDIVISLEKLEQQANEYGHSFFRELGFLVAHSMLHLLGYDHMTTEEECIMINKQNIILDIIKLYR